MSLRNTLLLFACLFGWALAAQAQPPTDTPNAPRALSRSERMIVFHAKLCRVSTASIQNIVKDQAIKPPVLFEVPNETIRRALSMVESKNVLAEPSVATIDGRAVSFLSGGEIALQGEGNKSNLNLLGFGTEVELLPRIIENDKIRVQFRFEQTALSTSGHSEDNASPTDIALISGVLGKGTAVVNPGQSLVAIFADPNARKKTNPESLLMLVLRPELVERDSIPLGPHPVADTSNNQPAIEIRDQPLIKLRQDLRGEFSLKVSESGMIVCPENIQRVSGFRSELISVSATGPRTLRVQAKQVGESGILVTDSSSRQYRVFVQVRARSGSDAVKDILAELFPTAQVTVVPLNESLLLRGTVTEPNHIQQITEITEQYAPKVLNHLMVASGTHGGFPPKADPIARSRPKGNEGGDEVQQLRQEVKSLHHDVKHILNLLERKASQPRTSNGGTFPAASARPTTPNEHPRPATVPSTPILVPPYPGRTNPPASSNLPNSTGPSASPNFQPWNPAPRAPQIKDVPEVSRVPQPASKFRARQVATEPVSKKLDPSSFVLVRTARISSPNDLPGVVRDETLGSGVVIESERGRAIVLTAAHILKDYKKGKFVLQVGGRRDTKTTADKFSGFYPATVILQDSEADVAILRAKLPGVVKPVSLAGHSLPDKEATVRCIGHVILNDPRTRVPGMPRMVTGKVASINRYMGPENFEFAGLIPTGFSGAAVLDSENRLIGIATAVDLNDRRTLCNPVAELRKHLFKNEGER